MFETRKNAPIVSVVGAGGKTTLIYDIASNFEKEGRKAIITTTTHMKRQNLWKNAYHNSVGEIKQLLQENNIIIAGTPCGDYKIKGLNESVLTEIINWEIPILIEADGAKRMPCKIPRENEPVIIPQTNIVMAVIGLDALHKPIEKSCFCPDKVADFLNCSIDKTLTYEDICSLLTSTFGMKKGVTKAMRYCIVLNKADTIERKKDGHVIKKMLEQVGEKEVYITAFDVKMN